VPNAHSFFVPKLKLHAVVAAQQKIRIKLKSYDHSLVDKWAEKIIDVVKQTDAIISGPIPLPTESQVIPSIGRRM
jgi:SSU ribosomal protein S10P